MGLIETLAGLLFGGGRNVLRDTAEVFFENAEGSSLREAQYRAAALEEFAAEFARAPQGRFDRIMDGLNRLPRPALAFGTLGLFLSAMTDPVWFAARMQGLSLVPEPLWWLLGAIVSFYFGARAQAKGQAFRLSLAETALRAGAVAGRMRAIEALSAGAGMAEDNPALNDWRQADGK